jgi:hypothetical protein
MKKDIKSTELISMFKNSNKGCALFEGELTAMEMASVEGGAMGLVVCCIGSGAVSAVSGEENFSAYTTIASTATLAKSTNFTKAEVAGVVLS